MAIAAGAYLLLERDQNYKIVAEIFRQHFREGASVTPESISKIASPQLSELMSRNPDQVNDFFKECGRLGEIGAVEDIHGYVYYGSHPLRARIAAKVRVGDTWGFLDTAWVGVSGRWLVDSVAFYDEEAPLETQIIWYPEKFAATEGWRSQIGSDGAETYQRTHLDTELGKYTVYPSKGRNDYNYADQAAWIYHNPNEPVEGEGREREFQAEEIDGEMNVWVKSNSVGEGFEGYVYYTLDRTTPEGSQGVGKGNTRVAQLIHHHTQAAAEGHDDWWVAKSIPVPRPDQTLLYKIGIVKTQNTSRSLRGTPFEVFAAIEGERCRVGGEGAETYTKDPSGNIVVNETDPKHNHRGKYWKSWVLHDPHKKVEEMDGGDPFQLQEAGDGQIVWVKAILEGEGWRGFVYYTEDNSFPEGAFGTADGSAKVVELLPHHPATNQIPEEDEMIWTWWVSPPIPKGNSKSNFAYKIGFFKDPHRHAIAKNGPDAEGRRSPPSTKEKKSPEATLGISLGDEEPHENSEVVDGQDTGGEHPTTTPTATATAPAPAPAPSP